MVFDGADFWKKNYWFIDITIQKLPGHLRAVISKIQAISRNFDTDGSQIQPNSYILFITLV